MQTAKELDARKFPPTKLDAQNVVLMQNLLHSVSERKGSDDLDWSLMERITSKIHQPNIIDYEKLLEVRKTAEKYLNYYQHFSTILSTVSDISGISEHEIKTHHRKVSVKDARHVVMFCIRWTTKYSLQEIGKLISPEGKIYFHHSTIINACRSVVTGIKTKEKDLYLLLIKTILKLRDEGIEIDLKKDLPRWYVDIYNEDETERENLLVSG